MDPFERTVSPDALNTIAGPYAIINFTVPAEVTGTIQTVLLCDPHARYGVKRLDNQQIVIGPNEIMGRPTNNGVPTGTIAGPYFRQVQIDFGCPYEWYIKVTTTTETRYFHGRDVSPLPTGTASAAGMAEMIRATLRSSPAAMLTMNVDGQQVTYSRKQAIDELQYWERRAAREAGRRPRVFQIGMDF